MHEHKIKILNISRKGKNLKFYFIFKYRYV